MSKTESGILAAERRAQIRRLLADRGVVRVDELCAELDVSAATVRRDLVVLDRRGGIRRVHGGAVRVEQSLSEPVFDDKAALAAPEKQRIARAALAFIKPNDSIFLDGGSTVLALAGMLRDLSGLTVVTNSLRVAGAFASGGPRTILVGGELRRLSQTFVGSMTQSMIAPLQVDAAFMGTIGLSSGRGMTTTDPREAQTKECIIGHAHEVFLLADSTKIGKVSFVRFGALGKVDILITDRGADPKDLRSLRRKGIKIIAA